MTKAEALALFRATILPSVPKHDKVMRREEWSNFTDALCKSGEITLKQYESWSNPF